MRAPSERGRLLNSEPCGTKRSNRGGSPVRMRSARGVKSAARDGRGAKMLRIFVNSDGSAGGTARVLGDECLLPVDKCLLLFLFLGLLCYVNNIA